MTLADDAIAGEANSTGPDESAPQDGRGLRKLTAGTARLATAAGVRQVLNTASLAITAALVARYLGPQRFGVYSGGTAGYNLLLSLTDLGFSLVLVREMSRRPEEESLLMGAGLCSQIVWSTTLGLGLAVLGLIASGTRGLVMLALVPAIAFSGLSVTRQIFSVRFRAAPLLIMDLSTTSLQCIVMVVLAVTGAPIIALAANLSLWTSVSAVLAFILARRVVPITPPSRSAVLGFMQTAIPLGAASVLASLYFTIDQTLLGWLVPPQALGHYAAAVRLLTVVVVIPGFIMTAGVTGLSRTSHDRDQLTRFAGTLAHWIAISALPLAAGLAVFAKPAVLIMFGGRYVDAIPLIRILMIAGFFAFVSNVLGIVLMTQGIVKPQIIFNLISLTVNVAGNILLVPHYGVTASAWLTVASEIIVTSYGIVVLSRRLSYPTMLALVGRPIAVVVAASALGLALGGSSALAIVVTIAAFLAGMTATGGWPAAVTTSGVWLRVSETVRRPRTPPRDR